MNLIKNYTPNKPDHSTYGGYICFADFNTNGRGDEKKYSEIAKRITDDWKFDDKCKKLEKIIKEHIRKELNKMNKKLKYEKINNNPNAISIDLLNGYSVIAISGENKELESYTTTLFLKENSIETLRLIGCADKLIFPKEQLTHGINFAILKTVSDLLDGDTLQYYIDQYEFEEELLTEGISRLERE